MTTILMYHYIGDPPSADDPHRGLWVPEKEFAQQLDALKKWSRPVVVGSQYDEHLKSKSQCAWITFDDGRLDNYTKALPLLLDRGMKATFFIVSDWTLSGSNDALSKSQMIEMHQAGMEIGCHTATHPKLATLSKAELVREIVDSKKKLEDAIGAEVTSFCYPYGNKSQQVVDMVREAGYTRATSTVRDNRSLPGQEFVLRRAMVQPGRVGWRFRYMFSPLYHFIHDRKNRKRWKDEPR